jgi:hypothetical protein
VLPATTSCVLLLCWRLLQAVLGVCAAWPVCDGLHRMHRLAVVAAGRIDGYCHSAKHNMPDSRKCRMGRAHVMCLHAMQHDLALKLLKLCTLPCCCCCTRHQLLPAGQGAGLCGLVPRVLHHRWGCSSTVHNAGLCVLTKEAVPPHCSKLHTTMQHM